MSTSRHNPTICFLASTLVTGGAERVVLGLGSGLRGHGMRCVVVTLHEAGPVGEELEELGIEVVSRTSGFRHDPGGLLRLASILKRESVDILFCLDHHNAVFWGALASRMAGVENRVLAVHSTGLWGKKSSFTVSDRVVLPLYDKVIALARSHADHLEKEENIPAQKIAVIHNGVYTGRFVPAGSAAERARLRSELEIPETAVVVTIVAALRPEKNHEMLLRAAAELSGRGYIFLVVGEGKEEGRLRDLTERLSLEKEVRFMGRRSDIPDILSASDMFVLCSHPVVETFPLSVLEAMSSGLPIIATNIAGNAEVLAKTKSGILIPPNDPDELSNAILRLLDNKPLREEMGSNARKLIEHSFDWNKITDKIEMVYQSVLS